MTIKTIIYLFAVIILSACGNNNSSDAKVVNIKSVRILCFVDFNLSSVRDELPRYPAYLNLANISKTICETKSIRDHKIKVEIYPLFSNTSNGEKLSQIQYDGDHDGSDLYCRDFIADNNREIKRGFRRFYEQYQDKSQQSKIIESLDVLSQKLRSINFNDEDVHILYVSNMLEQQIPSSPVDGKFNFIKENLFELERYSIKSAIAQLNEEEPSYLKKQIKRFKDKVDLPSDEKLVVTNILMRNYNLDPGDGDVNFTDVVNFWQDFFEAAGFSYNLIEAEDFKSKNLERIILND